MPQVRDVLVVKGASVHSVSPSTTVFEAIQKMNQHKIGAVLVTQSGRAVGIFTERDVLRRVLAEELAPREVSVGEVMTKDIICVEPDTDLDDVSSIMRQRHIRHIPVCDDGGKVHGMVSIGDVNAYHASNQEAHITFLNDYIYGRA